MPTKRSLLWDWTNTDGPNNAGVPNQMDQVNFAIIASVSNWNTWVPPELKNRAPFRPMIRSMAETSGDNWTFAVQSPEPIIHFFNEPERQGISPEQARDIWNAQMLPLRRERGKKLVSPSCSNDENGRNWIDSFMDLVRDDPPDYLGLHYYGTDADAFRQFLQDMHARHPGQPVIVSEWACVDREYGNVLRYTVESANWMEGQDWIFEHSLFGCMRKVADDFVSPAAQLMDAEGNFTDLFWKYQSDVPMHT